jgi:hypothetical protein
MATQAFPSAVRQGVIVGEPALMKKNQIAAASKVTAIAKGRSLLIQTP